MSYWLNFCQDSNNFNTIDNRANFFAASNQYEKNLGVGARQFGGADKVSRAKDGILSADDYNRIVRDSTNAGTYNYYGPKQDGIGHKDYDVDPWADFGSGNGDNTSYDIRHSGSGKVFGEFKLWDNKEDSIKKFKKADLTKDNLIIREITLGDKQ